MRERDRRTCMSRALDASVSTDPQEGADVLVMDANDIFGDWQLKGILFQLATSIPGLEIAIPSSVLAEVIAAHQRASRESDESLLRLLVARDRLGFRPLRLEDDSRDYRSQLAMALEDRSVVVLPWPEESHEEVAERAALRVPPFDSKGGGYRDTLLWFAARRLAARGHRVFLASKDRAFAGTGNALAPSLAQEVDGVGGSVELLRDVKAWILDKAGTDVHVGQLADAERQVLRDQNFGNYIANYWFEDAWLTPQEAGLPPEVSKVWIAEVLNWNDFEPIEIKPLIGGGTYIQYALPMQVRLLADAPLELVLAHGWDYDPDATVARGRIEFSIVRNVHARIGAYFGREDDEFEIDRFEYEQRPSEEYPWERPEDGTPRRFRIEENDSKD